MNKRAPQLLLGLALIGAGAIALLDRLGVIEANLWTLLGTWWPLIVIGVGLAALISVPRAWVGPTAIIALGVFLQLQRLDVVEIGFWEFAWPVLLMLVGIALITRWARQGGGDDQDVINSSVLWWGSERRTRSQSFKGGSLTAVMGGIELDLREAGVVDRAEVAVFVFWAGVEIKAPPTWRVTVRGLPVLGGWENKTAAPPDPNAPELVVHITAIMGGVEIRN